MANGVEDGVEGPVQAAEQQQQEQNGQRLHKLPHLPREPQGLSGASSPALHGALSAASALAREACRWMHGPAPMASSPRFSFPRPAQRDCRGR